MADEQEKIQDTSDTREEVDIDALLDEVAGGAAAAGGEDPGESGGEETDPAAELEPDAEMEPGGDSVAADGEALSPADGSAGLSDSLNESLAQLAAVAARIERSREQEATLSRELQQQLSSGEKLVKGLGRISREMKGSGKSAGKERSGVAGIVVGVVTLLLSGTLLGLMLTEDRETLPSRIEVVGGSVDALGEQVGLIADRIFEQQQQMDGAIDKLSSLGDTAVERGEQSVPAVTAAQEISVDLTAVESGMDDIRKQIMAVHELLRGSEAHLPELKKLLNRLVSGQKGLEREQKRVLKLQQEMNEKKMEGRSYKFP